jgi:hypothetical protein
LADFRSSPVPGCTATPTDHRVIYSLQKSLALLRWADQGWFELKGCLLRPRERVVDCGDKYGISLCVGGLFGRIPHFFYSGRFVPDFTSVGRVIRATGLVDEGG